jgi:hypothetical protein
MAEVYETRVSAGSNRVRSASVSQNFGGEASVAVEVYGTASPGSQVAWELHKNGAVIDSKTFDVPDPAPTGGLDIRMGEYRGLQSQPGDLGSFSQTPPEFLVRPGHDSSLNDAYTSAVAFVPTGPVDTEQKAREALSAAGYSLVINDGPGAWRGQPPESFAFEDVGILEYLQATLLKTGARYWIEGVTVYIDGSAAPSSFSLPQGDQHLITGYSYSEDYPTALEPTPEPEPNREDYFSNCPEYRQKIDNYEPPPKTPETVPQGEFVYVGEAGEGYDYTIITRKNTYNRHLLSTEVREQGYVDTPSGKVFAEKAVTTTRFTYHSKCPDALTGVTEETYIAPDLSDLPQGDVEVADAEQIWNALVNQLDFARHAA